MRRLIRELALRGAVKLGVLLHQVDAQIARRTLPEFGNTPTNVTIELPRTIINPQKIFLGNDIWLGPGTLLMAITHYPTISMQHPEKELPRQEFDPKITIGNRVTSTANLQIAAMDEITIEDDVMFASNINITDGSHGYENANEPYKYQRMFKVAPILIKRGSWIGQNVVVLPGVTIGEFAIIAANTVVTQSIPARSIAIGSPARVIKQWDETKQRWVTVNAGQSERQNAEY